MSCSRTRVLFSFIASLALFACQSSSTPSTESDTSDTAAKAATQVNWEALAQRLVTQNASVRENDIVQISGGVQDIQLLEEIAVQVRKVGAFPLVRVLSDQMDKRMITDVPEKNDAQQPRAELQLAAAADVWIDIDHRLTENLLADADPKRIDALARAGNAVGNELGKRKVRQVFLSNGLYPTAWRAKRYGLSEEGMKKAFWDGVSLDYSSLQATGEAVRKVLSSGSALHITNPNGTDLKVSIKGSPWHVSDGVVRTGSAQRAGANPVVWLPAGEVLTPGVAGTAEGKVVFTLDFYEGKEIQNLTVTFSRGKVTSITGSGPGFESFKARYEAAGSGKDEFSQVDFGINPNFKTPPEAKLGNWVSAGTITVSFGGDNTAFGGTTAAAFGENIFLPGSTVTLDGKNIIDNGKLLVQ